MKAIILRVALSLFLSLISYFSFDLSELEGFSLFLSIYILFHFVSNFGRSIYLILDTIVLLACLTWLVTPLFFYHYYNSTNFLANLWVKTMQVGSEEYYSFVFPGVLALWLGLRFKKPKLASQNFKLSNITPRFQTSNFKKIGFILTVLSLFSTIFVDFVPGSIAYVFYLTQKLIFVGLIYLYYASEKRNIGYLLSGFGLLMFTSIRGGMFGEMVFMLLIGAIIFSTNYALRLRSKILIAVLGFAFIIVIQSVKGEYRKVAWVSGASSTYFADLVADRISNPSKVFDPNALFPTAVRFNQGWLIASTMARVPSVVPYAEGETIYNSVLAILVPRFLWPDKPSAGGSYNLKRFLGFGDIGYSMNIGPIGEAWANFGKWGGIFFMFLYGLFFRFIFDFLLGIVNKRPSVIIWFPLLFFYAVGVETDILTTLNSLVKTMVFVGFVFWIFPKVFRIEL